MLLQWQLRMKPGNNTISQKSVQHSKCASLSTRGEPKMNVVQPLFLRHSQFSNYLALSQVAHCPSPLHQTQSPADFTFKCSLEASLSPPPQIIPLHPLPWLQHNPPPPPPAFLVTLPQSLLLCQTVGEVHMAARMSSTCACGLSLLVNILPWFSPV